MKKDTPLEIERKFLIEYPDISELERCEDCKIKSIVQTYLLCDTGTLRVRKTVCRGKTEYRLTEKRPVSDMSRLEEEKEISEETYGEMLRCTDTRRTPIEKVRYAFPFASHTMEIDVYPFWSDRAILEIELSREDERYEIPDFIHIIKEVTGDGRYSNKALAKSVVTEEL